MENIKKCWLRITTRVFSGMLLLIGFSSCLGEDGKDIDITLMYGIPRATYTIKGKVINESKEVVSDIQVIVKYVYNKEIYKSIPIDTVYSDKKGEFLFSVPGVDSMTYGLIYNDGHKDGIVYKTDSTYVEMLNPAEGGQYDPNLTKEVTIELKKKK